ncbi:hypothetical protein AB0I68_18795 [Streptomyces sp. NPDC050448]
MAARDLVVRATPARVTLRALDGPFDFTLPAAASAPAPRTAA